eukprot:scaffold15529_cov49-Attheya_sp.AAC.3
MAIPCCPVDEIRFVVRPAWEHHDVAIAFFLVHECEDSVFVLVDSGMVSVFFVCVEVRACGFGLKYTRSTRCENTFYVIVDVIGYDVFEMTEDFGCISISSKCFSRVKEWLRDGRPKPRRINSAFEGKVCCLPLMLPVSGSQPSYSGDGWVGLGVVFVELGLTLAVLDWVSDV